jgi:glyoxylase-like metal-dependent hydrolase (beta-lactamase superfamily II)
MLFTGDTAAEREGGVFLGPFNTDRERVKESFRRLAVPDLTTVCFGHGAPLLGERAGLLRDLATMAEIPDPSAERRPPGRPIAQAWLRA